ncbi:T9SS type A sorting domain-containing protein [Candidatus Fermentibacterales bacterium]|nr:T9SS type A sorting domain-containing protein [Candidatus Fermentibacterales bacterium]
MVPSLSIYGLDGRLLMDMTDCLWNGAGDLAVDVSSMCSGVYLCRLVAGDISQTRAFVVMR